MLLLLLCAEEFAWWKLLLVVECLRSKDSALDYCSTALVQPVLDIHVLTRNAITIGPAEAWNVWSGEDMKPGAADLGTAPEAGGALSSSTEIRHVM